MSIPSPERDGLDSSGTCAMCSSRCRKQILGGLDHSINNACNDNANTTHIRVVTILVAVAPISPSLQGLDIIGDVT